MVCFVYLPFKKTSTISSSSIDGLGGICLPPIAGEHDKLLEHCTNRRNNPGREFGRIRGAIIWMKCVCLDFRFVVWTFGMRLNKAWQYHINKFQLQDG